MKLNHYINKKLNSSHDNIDYEFDKNLKKYSFFLDNIQNYIYITNGLIFIRENDEYIFTLNLSDENTANIKLKEEDKVFDIDVLDASYKISDNVIEFSYLIDEEEGLHHIIMKVDD